jgi:hypothetical protein
MQHDELIDGMNAGGGATKLLRPPANGQLAGESRASTGVAGFEMTLSGFARPFCILHSAFHLCFGVALRWLWGRFGVALYSQVDGFVVALWSLWGGFEVALYPGVYA